MSASPADPYTRTFQAAFDASPNPYLVLDRDLNIVGANRAYLASTKREFADIVGRWAWDAFPTDPETLRSAIASFEQVIRTKEPDTMALLRFDIPRPEAAGGGSEERYWSITHTPVLGADGEVEVVLQNPIDVTELKRLRDASAQDAATVRTDALQVGIMSRAQSVAEANLALKAESERFKEMFAQAPGFMAILRGPDHRFEMVNDAYSRLVGGRRVVGLAVRDALTDIEGDFFFGLLDRVYATGEPYVGRGIELTFAEGDGTATRSFVDFVYQPIRGDAGTTGIFVEGYDVTEAKLAADELREREQRLRLIVEAAHDYAILTVDAERVVTTWSAGSAAIFGYSSAEIVGQSADVLFTPEDRKAGQPAKEIAGARDNGGAPDVRWHLRKDGSRVFLNGAMRPLRDATGREIGFLKIARDETERRAKDEALSELNALLAGRVEERTRERDRLWETTNDLMGTAGIDGFLRTLNPAWTAMLGWTQDELLARPFVDLIDPADHAETAEVVKRLVAGHTVSGFVDRLRTKDGSWRTLMWTATPEAGTGRFYVVGRDVTEQRQAEEALRQSQKMEAVGQLTGGIAHDFNNLLAGISGSLELMQTRIRQGRYNDVDRYMTGAQGATSRAAALTHRLLAFSRRQTLDPKPTDVNGLVHGMEDLVRRTVGPAVEIEVVPALDLRQALVDPSQLDNALLNLCINARDAMPDGGRITITTANVHVDERFGQERDIPPGDYLTLCVSDTGTGMPQDVIDKAFDPFFTTKPTGQGTGLGLSMIYGFARQSGGQVRIDSQVGRGTTVRIYLPVYEGDDVNVTGIVGTGLTEAPRAKQGETVLIVDDEPTVRMLVTEVLQDLGYTAIEAADGPAGLKVLQSDARIDLLVTDVGLPGGMNGRQVADAARTRRPKLKVLFITGYAESIAVRNGRMEEGMHVLTKPFAMETLASKMSELLASPG